MDTQYDAIVIGAGMAGLTAARNIAKKGLKVAVLSRGLGTTNMSTGAIDLLGYFQNELVLNPEENIKKLVHTLPNHPYAKISNGDDNKTLEIFEKSIQDFIEITNMTYTGKTSQNVLLANYFGTFRPSCIVPLSQIQGNLLDFDDEKILTIGVRGYSEFNAKFFSKSLQHVVSAILKWATIKEIVSDEIIIPSLGKDKEITSIEIAEALDDEELFSGFLKQLQKSLSAVDASIVVVPAILGYKNWIKNLQILEKELGIRVCECLSLPPSVPGQRLQQILENAVNDVGVEIHRGIQVLSAHVENNECKTLETIADIYRRTFTADVFILATGSFIAEGLYFDGTKFYEPIFDLPVYNGSKTNYFAEKRLESGKHEIRFSGIKIDQTLRPLSMDGKVVAKNLFGAGSILADYDYINEKSGLGVALMTGSVAGQNAVDIL